ncbi:MAG: hypothetical protein OXC96_10080, partial [Cyanobacteria bacterium MAG CAR1_bin_15]|nr:hypothetical protein [Cyanobacteria bacterium MAG CAR1_bin_15]
MRPLYVFRRNRKTQAGPNDYGLLIDGGDAGVSLATTTDLLTMTTTQDVEGVAGFRGQRFPPPVGAGGRP